MNELVNLVVSKTHIPAATAQQVVNVVLDYLKKKLPAPVAGQLDSALMGGDTVKKAEGIFGSVLGKKK